MTPASYWKQVRETCDKATPGPWEATVDHHGDDWLEISFTIVLGSDHDNWHDDAEFIALARAALPLALSRIEELEAALTRAADDLESAVSYVPEYFQDKWEMDDDVKAARAALGEK